VTEPVFVDTTDHGLLVTLEDEPQAFFIRQNVESTTITIERNGSAEVLATFRKPDEAEEAYESATRAATLGDAISVLKEKGNGQEKIEGHGTD
jgi:hypothetical protein